MSPSEQGLSQGDRFPDSLSSWIVELRDVSGRFFYEVKKHGEFQKKSSIGRMLGSPVFRENTGNLYMKGETDRAGRGYTDGSRFFDGSDPSPSRKVQQEKQTPTMEELVFSMLPEKVPVAKPRYIGHYSDARAIILGIPCNFSQDRQG